MPIVIGPKQSLLNNLATGYGAAAAGYGTGYAQNSGGMQRALENQGEAWTRPIQAAATQNAGFFHDLAYQAQAQQHQMQMQQQSQAHAMSMLNQREAFSADQAYAKGTGGYANLMYPDEYESYRGMAGVSSGSGGGSTGICTTGNCGSGGGISRSSSPESFLPGGGQSVLDSVRMPGHPAQAPQQDQVPWNPQSYLQQIDPGTAQQFGIPWDAQNNRPGSALYAWRQSGMTQPLPTFARSYASQISQAVQHKQMFDGGMKHGLTPEEQMVNQPLEQKIKTISSDSQYQMNPGTADPGLNFVGQQLVDAQKKQMVQPHPVPRQLSPQERYLKETAIDPDTKERVGWDMRSKSWKPVFPKGAKDKEKSAPEQPPYMQYMPPTAQAGPNGTVWEPRTVVGDASQGPPAMVTKMVDTGKLPIQYVTDKLEKVYPDGTRKYVTHFDSKTGSPVYAMDNSAAKTKAEMDRAAIAHMQHLNEVRERIASTGVKLSADQEEAWVAFHQQTAKNLRDSAVKAAGADPEAKKAAMEADYTEEASRQMESSLRAVREMKGNMKSGPAYQGEFPNRPGMPAVRVPAPEEAPAVKPPPVEGDVREGANGSLWRFKGGDPKDASRYVRIR